MPRLQQPSWGRAPYDPEPEGPTGIDPAPDLTEPEPVAVNPGHGTRVFGWSYDTSPSVTGPIGPLNQGYVHNVISTNGQWSRGQLPDLGYGYAFALRRPRFMREPRTDLGTTNLARG